MNEQSAGAPPVTWQSPPEPTGPAPGVLWAGYGERLVAYIVDGLILGLVMMFLSVLLVGAAIAGLDFSDPRDPSMSGGAIAAILVWFVVVLVVSFAYFPYFWARGGQTPGMRIFGIRVVRDRDGGPVTTGPAILRLIGYWVSAFVFYIGYVWMFLDSRRRGWHDLIAGTVVIKDAPR